MVKITPSKLTIEIATCNPHELLYELQRSIIKLLQLRDYSQETDNMEILCALELLADMLPTNED